MLGSSEDSSSRMTLSPVASIALGNWSVLVFAALLRRYFSLFPRQEIDHEFRPMETWLHCRRAASDCHKTRESVVEEETGRAVGSEIAGLAGTDSVWFLNRRHLRSEEHTSEIQSLA